MKVLIAPLNWGLGHASRCVPLVEQYIASGDEVILGGDGDALTLLRQHFPMLRTIELAPLTLHYSKGKSQVWALVSQVPRLIAFVWRDHQRIKEVVDRERIDMVVSDNRFGLWTKQTRCVYMTHQLRIAMPRGWQWAERIASRMHACIYKRYDELWVPDVENEAMSLSGVLGHVRGMKGVRYIGPLSRLEKYRQRTGNSKQGTDRRGDFDVVAVLSGLEPQRTLFEREIAARYVGKEERVLIVRGKVAEPNITLEHGNVVRVNHLGDKELAACLLGAKHIIARSGYSTIMDLAALGVLEKAELHATPGQSEQEYLEQITDNRNGKFSK